MTFDYTDRVWEASENGEIIYLDRGFSATAVVWPLSLNEYQERAASTAVYPVKHEIVYPALGLAGEVGEVVEKIKKVLRDNDGEFTEEVRAAIAKEIGDVLWYVSALSRDLGFELEEIAQGNLDKLASRKERGVLGGSGDDR